MCIQEIINIGTLVSFSILQISCLRDHRLLEPAAPEELRYNIQEVFHLTFCKGCFIKESNILRLIETSPFATIIPFFFSFNLDTWLVFYLFILKQLVATNKYYVLMMVLPIEPMQFCGWLMRLSCTYTFCIVHISQHA